MSRLSDSTARHARHDKRDRRNSNDTCSRASPQRGLSWICLPHFSRSFSWNWCNSRAQKTKLVHASITASSSSAMLEQARLDTLDTLVTTRATWTSRRDCRVVTEQAEYAMLSWRATHKVSGVFLTLTAQFRSPLETARVVTVSLRCVGKEQYLIFYC